MTRSDKKIFAITGGIGSGKTVVSDIIKNFGYEVFSCDEIYSDLLKDDGFLSEIERAFGNVRTKDGGLDRVALSQKVFSDADALKRLNRIAHPAIMGELFKRAENTKGKIVFCEVPLLFENSFERYFDGVIVVMRERSERIKAVMLRSNLTEEQVEERIAAQCNYDKIDLTGCYVIENKGDKIELLKKVKKIIQKIL